MRGLDSRVRERFVKGKHMGGGGGGGGGGAMTDGG
jgi:hypothetical protein